MKILDHDVPLLENLRYSLRTHWFLWALLIFTVILDFATTLNFMWRDGIELEKNPVIRGLATLLGIVPGVVVGKLLQIFAAVVLTSLSKKLNRAVLLLIVLLNIWAIFINSL